MNSYELQELSSSGLGVESGGKEREKPKRTSRSDRGGAVWRCEGGHRRNFHIFVRAYGVFIVYAIFQCMHESMKNVILFLSYHT